MEQRNNKQDRIIFEVEELLNKMSNQVNFLIRKEIAMNQLDLDLLMENTRKLYDRLCSVELGAGDENLGIGDEDESDNSDTDVDVDVDTDADTDTDFDTDSDADSDSDLDIDTDLDVDLNFEEDEVEDEVFGIGDLGVEGEEVEEEEVEEEEEVDMVWDFTRDADVEDADSDTDVEDADSDTDSDSDFDSDLDIDSDIEDFDSDLNIDEGEMIVEEEIVEEAEESEEELEVVDSSVDNIVELKKEEVEKEEDSGIRAYRIVRENVPTLSDVLERTEDNSLAARLQRKPVSDLISAIGINDKFLFLNELFNGSMEKYNKSIRSLNSFSTLLGAKTYMSELQIEFQWDCNSDAYKKLNDLVERRFL